MASRTTQQPEAPEQVEENEVTRPSDLGFGNREIEVEPVKAPPPVPDNEGYVVIRMAETIEEFTYGNQRSPVELERGKMYRVPVYIAQYLNSLGKLLHTS